ncbi:MAG: hypothetical protein JOZ87_10615 [Chloroflexi bacterium]|nr:hypothetical protein [Chloroflexota bacterium]
MIYRRVIYTLWVLQTAYLTLTAVGVKRDTRPHLAQSFSLLTGLIVAFVLPHLRPFTFLTLILGPLFVWRAVAEDRLMKEQFPDAYPAYRRTTRALIPWVW